MSRRAVFEASEDQILRLERVKLNPKKLGSYASDAFEEWLKRREGRANRAALQNLKYKELQEES